MGKELRESRLWSRPAARARFVQFLTHKYREKCRFRVKEVREISWFFVAPPRALVFPLSVCAPLNSGPPQNYPHLSIHSSVCGTYCHKDQFESHLPLSGCNGVVLRACLGAGIAPLALSSLECRGKESRLPRLALKHERRILGHSSNPVCGFSIMEQVRLCAV